MHDSALRIAVTDTSPHLYRWMSFVDGENLAIRAKTALQERKLTFEAGQFYVKDVFLWSPTRRPQLRLPEMKSPEFGLQPTAIRAHYYTSASGDDARLASLREQIRECGFQPEVFKRRKEGKSKGVDIALARDLLGHAYKDNYDAALLYSGDGDYVPLVEDVQRLGKRVYVLFLDGPWVSRHLKNAADSFHNITPQFVTDWTNHLAAPAITK